MVILNTPIIYMLMYMGVWSERRAELEFSITPELVEGVLGILSKMDFKLHKRLEPVRGVNNTVFVDIEFDLVGSRGLRGYYGVLNEGGWYRGTRHIVETEAVAVGCLFSELYDYGKGLGSFEHTVFGVNSDDGKPREFSWLPIMVVLGRKGVIRGTRWGRVDIRLVYRCGGYMYFGGGLSSLAGRDFYRSEGWFYNDELRRYKPISDGLIEYEIEDMYMDIWGFWRDFSW